MGTPWNYRCALKCKWAGLATAQGLPSSLNSRSPKSWKWNLPERLTPALQMGTATGSSHECPELYLAAREPPVSFYSALQKTDLRTFSRMLWQLVNIWRRTDTGSKKITKELHEEIQMLSPLEPLPGLVLGWAELRCEAKYKLQQVCVHVKVTPALSLQLLLLYGVTRLPVSHHVGVHG